ncbi:MAG TPA: efflux RND transporter permease subunit [Gemmatimonadales bacterium]|nr:efflux RND transporter permease subunit [Gemmatimonadales bacterium]
MTERHRKYRGLPSLSISRPVGTMMLTSVIVVLGALFLSRLPLDLLPRIMYPQVRVSVNNPGVEPGVLEETIAKPVERALATTENLDRIETEIQEGRVGVNLMFRFGTNVDFALQDASKNLERVRSRLPEEADPPTVFKFDPSQSAVYEVGLASETRDLISLRRWVEDRLSPQLLTIGGVAAVDVSGGLVREIQVVLDQERLRNYGLTVSEVITAIRNENQDIAAGRISSPDREVVGKTAGKFRSVDDIRRAVITTSRGMRIPLTEVAEVRDTNQEQRMWVRLDGTPAVKMSIRKQPDANTVAVVEGVQAQIAELQKTSFFPSDIRFEVVRDQADFIRNSVNSVRDAALMGALLAMIMVLLFLKSLRKTFVIGISIPLAILATFVLMGATNLTLNIMSLGGLALGVGLLVDNSIVMLENIFRMRDEEGIEDAEEAAHAGAGQVQSAIIASTTTNIAAVTPFLLISGLASLIFKELILTITFAIAASLLVALTLVPMMSAQLAKIRFTSGLENSRALRSIDTALDRAKAWYRSNLPGMLRYNWAILLVGFSTLGLAWYLTRDLGTEFLPQVDDGNVGVFVGLPPGIPPQQTNAVALEVEDMVREMPHVKHIFTTAGGFLFGGSTSDRAGRGSLDIMLTSAAERDMSADEWVSTLQKRIEARGFAGARVFVRPPRIRGLRTSSSGSGVSLSILGDELETLQEIGQEIERRVLGVPGLDRLEMSSEEASPQIAIELDRERASYLGLSVAQVGQTIRTALDGTVATRYTEANREYDIRVMLPRDQFRGVDELAGIALFPQGGNAPIYLRDVARVYPTLGPTSILRENQNRSLRLTGEALTAVAPLSVVNDSIRARIAEITLPEGYSVIFGGEEQSVRETNRQLALVIFLALFLVFVVMAVQYESLVSPLVILTTVPLSLIGVAVGLRVVGLPMSAPVLLGVILLAGIVVNNGILLVEYIEQHRAEHGSSMATAAAEAGAMRLRPVLMTTLTTLLGMLPLAMGIGEGSELMRPLAVAVCFGLVTSMLLTFFVVPSSYVLLKGNSERLAAWLTGRREAAAAGAGTREVPVAGD